MLVSDGGDVPCLQGPPQRPDAPAACPPLLACRSATVCLRLTQLLSVGLKETFLLVAVI